MLSSGYAWSSWHENVALVNAKDYHKRHKVCEMHSKAPKVVVLGIEQRFCQQCSRYCNNIYALLFTCFNSENWFDIIWLDF